MLPIERLGVVGAGTMRVGVAQVAAQAGFPLVLYDVETRFLDCGRQAISGSLDRAVQRGRLPADERDALLERITPTTDFQRPFELMDLIGLDTNFAVTSSVFEQRFGEERFRPHLVQQRLVRAGSPSPEAVRVGLANQA